MSNFSFVKKFPIFGAIASLFCIVGILAVVLLPFGVNWFNFDIDFVGGTEFTYKLNKEVSDADKKAVEDAVVAVVGDKLASVNISNGTDVVIRTESLDNDTCIKVDDAIKAKYADAAQESQNNVSPVMGADIRDAAIISALLAVILMLVYIAIRFDIKSGLAAVIALIHDLLVMLSFYVILQIPLNMTFIAAALTILGYSINATIVIFDRVRENRKMLRKATFGAIVDTSIKQTFTRSLNTTLTTLFTIVLIAILGVPSIRNFAIPIAVGIIAGMFSSVCLSGPIWARLMGAEKKQ